MSALKMRIANFKAKNKGIVEEYLTKRHSPFTEDIVVEPLPEKLKIPELIGNEGEGDTFSHLDEYTSKMEQQGACDVIMCQTFRLTLGDKAQWWFRRMYQRSIKNWTDLTTVVLAQLWAPKLKQHPKNTL